MSLFRPKVNKAMALPLSGKTLQILVLLWLALVAITPVICGVYFDFFRVGNLDVKQEGLVLSANWERNKVGKYHVKVTREGEVVCDMDTNDTRFSMDLPVVEKTYKVSVRTRVAGGFLGTSSEKIDAEKADQNVYLSQYLVEGFEKKKNTLSGRAMTALSYKSSNDKVVTITPEGKIRYGKPGTAKITVQAAESDLYKAAKEVAVVNVYPTKLETPKLALDKTKKTSKTHTSVNWNAVPYASQYVVSKYDPWSGKMKTVKKVEQGDPLTLEIQRNDETYVVKARAEILGKNVTSDESEPLDIRSASHEAKTYNSLHILDVLKDDKLEPLMQVKGPSGMTCAQSFSYTGDGYLLAFTDKSGGKNALVEYSEDGKMVRSRKVDMGHANGSTYNPVTGKIYTLRRHLKIKSKTCKTFNFDDFSESGSFTLPKMASGISYDTSCDKYYLSGGKSVFVTDANFHLQKKINKVVRRNHTQDTGAANGVALSCSWNRGSDSYVDLYRCSDGGYLGTYQVPMGEIESATFVDKRLVVLINNVHGSNKDIIFRTKDVIPVI